MELEIRGRETVTLDRRPRAPLTPVDTPTWHNPLWPSYRTGKDSFSSLTFNANVAWVLQIAGHLVPPPWTTALCGIHNTSMIPSRPSLHQTPIYQT